MTSKETIKETVRAAFDNRVAVRVYNDKAISREDMEFILDSAWLSPSSIGLEGRLAFCRLGPSTHCQTASRTQCRRLGCPIPAGHC